MARVPTERRAAGRRLRRTRPARLAGAAFALGLALAAPAGAGEPTGAEAAPGERTGWQSLGYGITIAYGHGIAPRSRQRGRDVEDVRTIAIEPSVRLPLLHAGSAESWYHGRLEALFEALVLVNLEPTTGYGGGATAGLRYTLRPGRRIEPYGEATLGVGGIAFDLLSQDDGFAFFIQAGAGARIALDERIRLVATLRWQHISNAQTHLPNNGIDTIGVRIGVELW